MVAKERRPCLPAAAVEVAWPIFCDGTWRNGPAELATLGGDDGLAPGHVLAPEPSDERAQLRRNGWSPWRPFRGSPPPPAPGGAVPAEQGGGLDNGDRILERSPSDGERGQEPAFPRLEAPTQRSPLQNDELLAQEHILGRAPRARREEFDERDQDVTEEAQHGGHHARGVCRASPWACLSG